LLALGGRNAHSFCRPRQPRIVNSDERSGHVGSIMVSMWPFQKKTISPDRLPVDGPWSIAEGQHSGRVMFVRANTGYREFGSVPGYEHQVGIAVPLRKAEATGLPCPAEDALLGDVEEIICSSLEEQAESLLVAVITTGGVREFVFYTREPQRVQQRFEELVNRITSHEIQLMVQSDRTWRVYAQLGLG
jgi:hypothetical protein